MSDPILLYGASGYSGRLIARELARRGLRPVLAGRDGKRLEETAGALGLPHRVARVDDADGLGTALADVAVVVNAAGPFSRTAWPIAQACLERRIHYLDICGEVPVVDRLSTLHAAARARGVMVMPSVGFDVVPTDCLAAHVARRRPGGRWLTTAVSRPAFLSPGSAKTLLENVDLGVGRRDGLLAPVPLGSIERSFDFGGGSRPCLNVSFVDVVTAFFTTGIPNITTFAEATPLLRLLPMGVAMAPWLRTPVGDAVGRACAELVWRDPPGAVDTRSFAMTVVAEVEDGDGRRARARLTTPEAYDFTAVTAAAIASRVAAGDFEAGFQTPARVFGPDFVLSLPEVTRVDLDA